MGHWNVGKNNPNYGRTEFSKEYRQFVSKLHKGKILSEETKKKISDAHKGRKREHFTLEHRLKLSESHKAIREKCHTWKGGVWEGNRKIRDSIEIRLWREAVFARDNFTCQNCHIRGGYLEAHHIKKFAEYPELRFAIDNGLTLCRKCHNKTKGKSH